MSKPSKQIYLLSAIALFICGAIGGVLSALSEGSIAASIAQIVGYFGAGYLMRDYLYVSD